METQTKVEASAEVIKKIASKATAAREVTSVSGN